MPNLTTPVSYYMCNRSYYNLQEIGCFAILSQKKFSLLICQPPLIMASQFIPLKVIFLIIFDILNFEMLCLTVASFKIARTSINYIIIAVPKFTFKSSSSLTFSKLKC